MALARAKAAASDLYKFDASGQLDAETELLEALTRWFASKAAISAHELPDDLVGQMVGSGLNRDAVLTMGRLVLAKPLTGRSRHGAPSPYDGMPATRRVAAGEPEYRAQYLLASAKRLTASRDEGNYGGALVLERRYLDMHVAAGRGRRAAARAIDDLTEKNPHRLLVWHTKKDSRVDGRCASLEGRLFTPDSPPGGAYPGSVHPRCRCWATPWGGQLFV